MKKIILLNIFYFSFCTVAVKSAEKGGMPQLDPEFWVSQIFWLTITFGTLFLVLSKFILPRISKNLEQRRLQILENIETAEKQREQSEKNLKDNKKSDKLDAVQKTLLKPGSVFFVRQQNPLGLGHAVWCARNFISDEPVAIILADDLIDSKPGCMKQMIDNWNGGNMVATLEVEPNKTSSYGIISPGKIIENKIINLLNYNE